MYPDHTPTLTPAERMLDDWLRLDNHFLARGLSIIHGDHFTPPTAAHSPCVDSPSGGGRDFFNTAEKSAKGI